MMSLLLQSGSVIIMRRSRRAVRNVGTTFSVDFQELWEAWDSFIVPRFPSARHFHRGRRNAFCFVILTVKLTRILPVADLLAVGLDLRFMLQSLLCLDDRKLMAEPLVLDDRCVAHTLVFAEEAIGKRATF